jgi:pimeloyl-ACP methyl ester carboxylesterase
MPLITTPNASIWIADQRTEPTERPPLILLHGAGGTRLDWPAPLRRLSDIVPDLPGHGRSSPPPRTSIGEYAQDLVALMEALQIPRAVIAGHSMGGAIGQMMGLDFPDRVAGLILIATSAKLSVHPDLLDHVLTDQPHVVSLLVERYWSPETSEAVRAQSYQALMQGPPATLHADFTACNTFDVRSRLGEINTPALVIGATGDRMTPRKHVEFLASGIPNAKLAMLESAGHMLAQEKPDTIAQLIQEWLATTKPA